VLRFIQINDLHVHSTEAAGGRMRQYARSNEKVRWLIEAINQQAFAPLPEFVVGVGDLIHGGAVDRLDPDLKALQRMLEPLRCPFYPVVGNHEVLQQERSPKHLRAYMDAFGKDRAEYAFTSKGILFVVLNNSGAGAGAAATERNEWLGRVLDQNRDRPKIILCHIPLIALRDEATLARSFGFTSYRDPDPGTLKLVDQHAETVIAVLSGHLHLTGMRMRKDVCHFSLCGTASSPADGAAVFEVFPDRVSVGVARLPEDLRRSEPSIHGRPRHERDYVDAGHGSAETYQDGTAEERRFSIPLTGGKRPRP
jgi:hypothetical protein